MTHESQIRSTLEHRAGGLDVPSPPMPDIMTRGRRAARRRAAAVTAGAALATAASLTLVAVLAAVPDAPRSAPPVGPGPETPTSAPVEVDAQPPEPETESCEALARENFPDRGYDSTYDPETRTLTIYAQGRTFLVDTTDPVCVSSSPLISLYARSALSSYNDVLKGTCDSMRELLASGTTHVRGIEINREAMRRFVEEDCPSD